VLGDGQTGVYGTSGSLTGVYGQGGLIGVHAVSTQPNNSGVGLRVDGRSVFRTAGTAVVASGAKKVTVTLAGVTTADFVLATVQGSGAFYLKNASAGSGQFTITISKVPVSPAP
jgi:hypothetical protein